MRRAFVFSLGAVLAAASLLVTACSGGEDACYEHCGVVSECDHPDTSSAEYRDAVDSCYEEYENQGLNDPTLGPGIVASCQNAVSAWPGCFGS